jgi:hypothetical protein
MILPVDLVSFLATVQPWAATIGGRLYPIGLPQQPTLPAAHYTIISNPVDWAHDGPAMSTPRVQFDVYAATYQAAHATAGYLVSALNAWYIAHGSPAFADNEIDIPEPPELERYRVMVDCIIMRPA